MLVRLTTFAKALVVKKPDTTELPECSLLKPDG
jgi:hypothetical protein